jgi:hypothetical protein
VVGGYELKSELFREGTAVLGIRPTVDVFANRRNC